jgi:puromycin-sensitive aminopeptidase
MDGPCDWVVANGGGHGFYRVRYAPQLLQALVARLENLEPLERFTLLDDTWASTMAGATSSEDFLTLAAAYRDEEEHAVWQMLSTHLTSLSRIVPESAMPGFQRYVRDLVSPIADRLGWDPSPAESDLTRRLRGQVLATLGRLGADPKIIERAQNLWQTALDDPGAVDAEVSLAVLAVAATFGTDAHHEAATAAYLATDNPQLQVRFLRALTYLPSAELASKTIDMALDGRIRSQDGSWIVAGLMANRPTAEVTWRAVRDRWEDMTTMLPPMTQRYLVHSLPALTNPATAADVDAFFAGRDWPVAARSLEQKQELMHAMVAFGLRERERLLNHLGT